MKTLLLFSAVLTLVSASSHRLPTDTSDLAKAFLSKVMGYSKKECIAHVKPYPLNGIRLEQTNDDTSQAARTYYDNFKIKSYFVKNNAPLSNFQVAVEHKKPMQELSHKKAKIHFFNLLFTASLRIGKKYSNCKSSQPSLLAFVELVKTDTTWHRHRNYITQHRGKNLAKHDYLQYVMTKTNPKAMFANDSLWARAIAWPLNKDYIVPLKYESTESIEVDFTLYPDTVEYEKLIEKKVFLVQINQYNEVIEVVSGVDIMIYLNYDTISVTDVPNLNLANNHGLIQQIANPEKYASVITNLHRRGSGSVRDTKLTYTEQFPTGDTTLNPLPKSMRIYTE